MSSKTIKIVLEKSENSCFVVMPFSTLFQTQYEKIIRPVVTDLGLVCVRGDEIYAKQRIMDDIWNSIRTCRLVVAELTGKNPNVLYEIGLAHAIGKPVIIITRNAEDVPFDLKDLRYLFYDTNDPFWGENLKIGLKNLINKVVDSPDIGAYLSGIEVPNIKYGKLEIPEAQTLRPKQKYDLTATWKGNWTDVDNITHQVILHLNQNNSELMGTATLSFYDNSEEISVVHEILNGTINETEITLQGVNYSYVNRGGSPGYNLDNFIEVGI